MSVALVTYSTRPRGGVVHTLDLAEALLVGGMDIRIIALGDRAAGFFRETNVPVTFIPTPPWAETLDDRVFRSVDALADGLRSLAGEFSILHAQDCIAARAAARVRDEMSTSDPRRPIVVRTVHHVDDFTTQALIDCQRQAIIEPDALIVVSRQWQEILREEFDLEATVIYSGVNTARLARPEDLDRAANRESIGTGPRFLFLTVGGIEPRKGTMQMIEALAALKASMETPPMLAIVGGHSFQDHKPYRTAAIALAEQLGVSLESDIVQLGTVSDGDLAKWYHTADAFLFPSVKEGWGLVAMEAMAVGLPLIASDIPVFREYLVDGESAILVPPGDHRGLAAAMRMVIDDQSVRDRLSAAGRDVAQRFTWARAAADHRDVYQWLTSDRRATSQRSMS
ncbi:MAG TPA: MSMEG_0565 family glycosyltransferase [Acidimicrobiia bacterium]|nr:MSMEG_0565 family glycosyltransferase [Acidimicrobiia bacterium]